MTTVYHLLSGDGWNFNWLGQALHPLDFNQTIRIFLNGDVRRGSLTSKEELRANMIFKTDLNVHNACIIHVSCKSYFTQAKLTLLCFHQLSPTMFVLSLTCAYNTGILLGFITQGRTSWRVVGAAGVVWFCVQN